MDGATTDSRSYWHATAPPLVPSDPVPDRAAVAIIGGGLLGCWTAYWLAREGHRPVVIERTGIPFGATGRNGGLISVGVAEGYAGARQRIGEDDTHAIWQLTVQSRDLLVQTIDEEGIDAHLRLPGNLRLALGDEGLTRIERYQALLAEIGYAVTVLDREALGELIHTPLAEEITGAIYDAGNGMVHSAFLMQGVAGAAARHGAQLCHAEVTNIAADGDGLRVESSAGTVLADAVVVAVNAWTGQLIAPLADYIMPVRGQALSYAPLPPTFLTGVGVDVTTTGEYWQQTLDGSIVLGGCRVAAPGGDVGVREMTPTPEVQAAIEGVFPRLFPELTGLTVAHRWAGLMAFTSDYLPIVDRVPDVSRAWFVGGFCGHGMPYGPILGQLLTEAISTGTPPAALTPFRLDRPTLHRAPAANFQEKARA